MIFIEPETWTTGRIENYDGCRIFTMMIHGREYKFNVDYVPATDTDWFIKIISQILLNVAERSASIERRRLTALYKGFINALTEP